MSIPPIESLVWEFFKIPPTVSTGIFVDDLIYFIILPSVILLIFLLSAAEVITPRSMRSRWKGLIALVLYMVIVRSGLYTPFAVFIQGYIMIFIVLAFTMFAITRFIPMKYWKAATAVAAKYGEKQQDIRRLEDELRIRREERRRLEEYLQRAMAAGNQAEVAMWQVMINEIEREIDRLETRLREIRRNP